MAPQPPSTPSTTLHHPRILCFHGGGSTATIYRFQCRTLLDLFSSYFRLVFANGPFISPAGPGILPIFAEMGPYRRWQPPSPAENGQVADDDDAAGVAVTLDKELREVMEKDDESGATGEWVGVIGFSQGGKMAASILYDVQLRREKLKGGDAGAFAGGNWEFAVIMAGSAPLIDLRGAWPEGGKEEGPFKEDRIILPTVHVHGLQDWVLDGNRKLFKDGCEAGTAKLVEWEGDHRIPFKIDDARRVLRAVLATAVDLGVLDERVLDDAF